MAPHSGQGQSRSTAWPRTICTSPISNFRSTRSTCHGSVIPRIRAYSSRSCIGSLRGALSGTNDVPKRPGGHDPTDGKERQTNRRQLPRKGGQPTTNPEEPEKQAKRKVSITDDFRDLSGYGLYGNGNMVCSETDRWVLVNSGRKIPETVSPLKRLFSP